ncbi:MAG: type II toxin-antitoxin system HicB family antitoxin [Casimicrobiaceae bacterium]
MKTYSAVIERDPETGLFVGFVPGFPGAHSQGATVDELNTNLREVIATLLSACFSTATICSTENRFLFMTNSFFQSRSFQKD